jgi:EmrB/QacA subfamily drug resistance transporter
VGPRSESARAWWALTGACTGLFLLMLDSTVVVLALPSIQHDLDASLAGLQWVQNAYLLVIAALVVTLGRLGDVVGRRTVFVAGMATFAVGSVASGLADSLPLLVTGRVIQGVGGAAMLSLSLAIACDSFPGERQAAALGIWAAVSSIALAVGPLIGGLLIGGVSWRWIFWINLPVGVLGVLITRAAARDSRDAEAGGIDLPGAATLGAGLTMVVLAFVQSDQWGWGDGRTLLLLACGVAALAVFGVVEGRVAAPIVDFTLFRNRPYLGASAAAFGLVGAYWTVMFFQPQYLQNILDYSVIEAGALILPITVPMVFISPFAGRMIKRLGVRLLMTLGMLCALAGLILMTRVDSSSAYGAVLPGYLLFGVALGLVYAPMSAAAMAAMPPEKSGIASGVLAMNRVMAGAVALAVAGAVFQGVQHDRLSDALAERAPQARATDARELDGLLAGSESARAELAGQPPAVAAHIEQTTRETYTYALDRALWVLVALVAVGTLFTAILLPSRPGREPGPVERRHHLHHRRFHL